MAGLEERLSKLESIIHRLFCCDNSQFTGPQGPQGPMGIPGPQGPAGADGAIMFENLNWMGAWTSGVSYSQFDAVSYNGSSYFLNCEDNGGAENESPIDNPNCWVLLANAGATGPQGIQGLIGNDGSNSGRWKLSGLGTPSSDPGLTWFTVDSMDLGSLSRIMVSGDDVNGVPYTDWWQALYNFVQDYEPLVFIQITELGSNNVLGIYRLGPAKPPIPADITMHPFWVELGLDPLYVGNTTLNANATYTISWSLHGGVNSTTAPKTEGTITPVHQTGPYPTLEYDFNNLQPQPINTGGTTYFAALPEPTFIGQTLIVRGLIGEGLDYNKSAGVISHDGSSIISLNSTLTDNFTIFPQSCHRFTWSGTYWISESIEGLPPLFNDFKVVDEAYNIVETTMDVISTYPTAAYLNATYPSGSYPRGIKIYCPYTPGGPKVFTKISEGGGGIWASYPYTPVI